MADDIVEVAKYFNRMEAEVACARLRADNVASYLKTDDAGGIHPELDFTRGIRVMVLAGDEEFARELLTANAAD